MKNYYEHKFDKSSVKNCQNYFTVYTLAFLHWTIYNQIKIKNV